MNSEVLKTLLESKRVKLKQNEMLAIGRLTEFALALYAESSPHDTYERGEAYRIYALYRKLATRLLTARSSYRVSFNPSEQATLLYLINEYHHLLGIFEKMVAYKLRDELQLI